MLAITLRHVNSFLIISDMNEWPIPVGSVPSGAKNPISGTPVFLYNPISSETSDWTVLSWNPVSCDTTNSDHFSTPDCPESDRNRSDPEIGSHRFWMYESDRNSMDPTNGYQRKTADYIGIRQKVTDRIRLAVLQRIWYPFDRIRCPTFDLGGSVFQTSWTEIYTVKKKGILPNFSSLACFYETILSSVVEKSFRNFHAELF